MGTVELVGWVSMSVSSSSSVGGGNGGVGRLGGGLGGTLCLAVFERVVGGEDIEQEEDVMVVDNFGTSRSFILW